MKIAFSNRAHENFKAAELLFEAELYNASANRAYYAAFHLAIAAIYSLGIEPTIDHRTIQTLFSDNFFNRRKILPSKYKEYLSDLQTIRNHSDYKAGINKKKASIQLKMSNEFIDIVHDKVKI